MKVGQNDPCPCGSGKKYKKCHGIRRLPVNQHRPASAPHAINVDLSGMGLPGQRQHIIFQPQTDDPNHHLNRADPRGLPGQYEVTFVLRRPGIQLHAERHFSLASGLEGNSHIAITKPAYEPPGNPDADQIRISASIGTQKLTYKGYPNKKGFLGKIVLESIDADNLLEAHYKAYRALMPALSAMSAELDQPIDIYQIDTEEKGTKITQMTLTYPFKELSLAGTPEAIPSAMRGYTSIYREALISNSPTYQFLCFYKIIESLRKMRARLGGSISESAREAIRTTERIPEDHEACVAWLQAIYPNTGMAWDPMSLDSIFRKESAGKKFGFIIDNILRPLRDNIAHALLSESEELELSADEALHTVEIHKWLPLTKCIVRKMLKNAFPDSYLRPPHNDV